MRTMYDSTDAGAIPTSAEMVAGYVDGAYVWDQADWARFPSAVHVTIATQADTNAGDVLDVELGDATVAQAPAWCRMRIAAGLARPTLYIAAFQMTELQAALGDLPHALWVADWTGEPHPVAGAAAVQYVDAPRSGGEYDLSAVYDDTWFPSAFTPATGGDEMTLELAQLLVWQWYTNYLGRVGSQAEVDGWATQLVTPGANYEAVITDFYSTPEAVAYRAKGGA